jgi:hypothetical protein
LQLPRSVLRFQPRFVFSKQAVDFFGRFEEFLAVLLLRGLLTANFPAFDGFVCA